MADSYVVGAYWGSREEKPEVCAGRLNRLLEGLRPLDPVFASWFAKGSSARADRGKSLTPADVNDLATRGMNRRDLDASPIPSLGVRIGIWNGGREGTTAVGVTTSCGCFDEPGSAFALNSLLISLPNQGPDADRILTVPVLQRILDAAVRAFDPDWAVVVSRAHMKSWPTGSEGGPHAGWITYVSSRNMKAKLAADCRDLSSVNVAALGTAWISTEERFSSGNPVHVARARVVEEIVGRKA